LCRRKSTPSGTGSASGKQQPQGGGADLAGAGAGQLSLQSLLTAEVVAVAKLVDSSLGQGPPVAPGVLERVKAWGDVPVSVEVLQDGLGVQVRGLAKRKEAAGEVAAAAAQVVAAWKAQISQQGKK
jgi:hypothetical protein